MKTKNRRQLDDLFSLVPMSTNIPTKNEMDAFAFTITEQVLDGHISGIDVHMRCKALIKIMETILADTEHIAIDEIVTRGHNNELEHGTATAKLREGFNVPNYEDDQTYCSLKAKLKERESLLKLAFQNPSVECTDTESGEIVPVLSPKPTKQSIAITFKK